MHALHPSPQAQFELVRTHLDHQVAACGKGMRGFHVATTGADVGDFAVLQKFPSGRICIDSQTATPPGLLSPFRTGGAKRSQTRGIAFLGGRRLLSLGRKIPLAPRCRKIRFQPLIQRAPRSLRHMGKVNSGVPPRILPDHIPGETHGRLLAGQFELKVHSPGNRHLLVGMKCDSVFAEVQQGSGRIFGRGVGDQCLGGHMSALFAAPFLRNQAPRGLQAFRGAFLRHRFVEQEIRAMGEHRAGFIARVHHGYDEGGRVGRCVASGGDHFDGGRFIVAVHQHHAIAQFRHASCRHRGILARLRPDSTILQNPAEHFDCFCVGTHHERCKSHTSGMLSAGGKHRQVTQVTTGRLGCGK
jgi:hypothetical protein